MKIIRGYKVELDLNDKQITACKQHAGCARFAYNWGLKRRQEVYKTTGHGINAIELHKELNKLKQSEYPWMYKVSKCAPQEALRDLDKAFEYFFRRCQIKKQGKYNGKVGYPTFKSKKQGLGHFRLTGQIHVYEDTIKLPRLGRLRLKERGYIPTSEVHILSATVSEHAGHWFVSVQVIEEVPDPTPATGTPLGVDLGITTLAACSDGTTITNPKALRKNLKRLKRLHRCHSRRKRGSKNREKARKQLAHQYYRVGNVRQDALHKATSLITAKTKPDGDRPHKIVLEDLNVEGMRKNRRLAQAISDVGMGEFKRQMQYKALWMGEVLLQADRFYPSTKRCSSCGNVKREMSLSERVYNCEQATCGLVLDRDLNAALNLVALAQ